MLPFFFYYGVCSRLRPRLLFFRFYSFFPNIVFFLIFFFFLLVVACTPVPKRPLGGRSVLIIIAQGSALPTRTRLPSYLSVPYCAQTKFVSRCRLSNRIYILSLPCASFEINLLFSLWQCPPNAAAMHVNCHINPRLKTKVALQV